MHLNNQKTRYTLLLALIISLYACAGNEGGGDRAQMCKTKYDDADKEFKAGHYGKVKEPLEEILNLCIGTGYMEQTQFLLAESYFNLEEWLEARGEYGSFVNNFPSSPYIETAEFRKAISSFNMEYNVARDESNTTQAMKDFERFASNYPDSPLIDSVKYYQNLLLERKAEHDYMVAKLYLKMDHPQASVIYLKEFLDLYPNSKRRPEALFLLISSYADLDQFETARTYLEEAKNTIPETVKDKNEEIADLEKYIAKTEQEFQAKIAKEQKKKLKEKEEAAAEAE